ncbi:uncharacterized protein LOC120428721 isoform X1 [Culex pipiens pallens]|uniref:uncharacterized protein LOC120428721 isoform X1 n=1 Tax=Culex pipiens pallens TaxID=42434 RepID=UPI0019533D14|nr:uncharacterized protein LOC120428721 isoform X1 [Culex pipiens pallens]
MLTTVTLVLVASAIVRIGPTAAQAPQPSNDQSGHPKQSRQMLLPTVPPDMFFQTLPADSAPPLVAAVPTIATVPATSALPKPAGANYEHSIALGPNSNYYVYYSDNVQGSQTQRQQQPQPTYSYQPLVGFPDERTNQVMFNPNVVPFQLVTLVQPTLDDALQQENATDEAAAERSPNLNEEGIQKLVSSTQDLVTNEDVVSINNAEEEKSDQKELVAVEPTKGSSDSDSETSESHKEPNVADNLAIPTFQNPIVVGEMPEGTSRSLRSGDNLFKQINVEIIGESDDHNKGQFLKETIFSNQVTPEPCDDDAKSTQVIVKHEVTTIRPVTAKLRGSTASRLSTRYRTTTVALPSTTPKSVSNQYLAPVQAGPRLSNTNNKNIDDCIDTILQAPKQDQGVERTVVEVQKSINIKNIVVNQEQPKPRKLEFGTRTNLVPQPIVIEKPVDRIVKQNVYIEKPVDRVVQQPVYIEKPVPQPVDRIVEKKVPVPYPVDRIVEKPVQTTVHVPYPVEKHIPVHHYIDRPVTKTVTVEVPVERIVDRPVPVEKIVTKEVQVPYPVTQVVEKIVDRPVETVVEKHVEVPVPVTVEKVVEKFIDRPVPYPVQVPVEVQVPVHYPVEVPVGVPIPYPVEKLIPVIHEQKPTHAIIKTTTHHTHDKLFDFHKFFGGKKKHYVEHIYLKAPLPLAKPPFHYHNPTYPKNDLHFGASIAAPSYIDVAQVNVLPHHYADKPAKPVYNLPPYGDVIFGKPSYATHFNHFAQYPQPLIDHSHFVGKFTYQPQHQLQPQIFQHQHQPQQIFRDDYVGPTPLLEDHWAVKSDVKFRRSPAYGKSLRIEYGGFKPPLVPSLEIDENGVPLHKEDNDSVK